MELIIRRLVADYYGQDAVDIIRLIHQEVLLSFRLIFGSTSQSQARIHRDYLSKQKRHQWRGNEEFLKKLISPSKPKAPLGLFAKILHLREERLVVALPEEYWPQAVIMNEKLTEDQTYSASAKFAVFGPRLLRLQEHCSHQISNNVWDMWRDRRDRQSWITFWAVLIFGSTSLLLTCIQVILAIVNVYEQKNGL